MLKEYKGKISRNLSVEELYQKAIERKEGILSSSKTLVVTTGKYTGRSPFDRYIVDTQDIHDTIDWDKVNVPISVEKFEILYEQVINYLKSRNELFVVDAIAGSQDYKKLKITSINEFAFQNLFLKQMLKKIPEEEISNFKSDLTLLVAPGCKADYEKLGLNSEAFIVLNYEKKLIIIGGSRYCGEQKKAIFTYLNSKLPEYNIFPMHCSANVDEKGDVALFFGLSGTGKTTLSTSPNRKLIGDDEHGWSENGIFNFEGGCYAKCIDLSKKNEPNIYNAIKHGAIVENVILKDGEFDFYDDTLTKNTRAAFPVEFVPDAVLSGTAGQPKTIIFLTADAFGVLPPIAKLNVKSAAYYFLLGYTSKLAGTVRGIDDPVAVFSSYFGKPFMPLKPKIYSDLFRNYILRYKPNIFLINTGWIGGPFGVGKRIDLPVTRRIVDAALDGELDSVEYSKENVFNLNVPLTCPGVDSEVLNPRELWKDKEKYDSESRKLAQLFVDNFKKFGQKDLEEVGPKL